MTDSLLFRDIRRAGRHRSGATLVELFVVVGIVVILLGLGLGAYVGIREGSVLPATADKIASVLRSARNSALVHGDYASVEFSRPEKKKPFNLMNGYALRPVAVFHFDAEGAVDTSAQLTLTDINSSGFGHRFTHKGFSGSEPVVAGKYGRALHFDGQSWLEANETALYMLRDGVHISTWARPSAQKKDPGTGEYKALANETRLPILAKFTTTDGIYALYLIYSESDKSFSLAGSVLTGDDFGNDLLTANSEPVIRPNVWSHVAMSYRPDNGEESEVMLYVDGMQVKNSISTKGGKPVVQEPEPITVGSLTGENGEGDFFVGDLDEVRLSGFIADEPYKITDTVEIELLNTDDEVLENTVRFNSLGRLESTEPLTIRISLVRQTSAALPDQFVHVDLAGNVRVEREQPSPPATTPLVTP